MTDQEYIENPDLWGESQYVTLDNIIDNIMILADDDSYFKHVKKHRALIYGKMGIKKLNVDVQPDNKAISITVPPSKIFPFPRYMTNWKRISVLNKCGKLQPININNSPQIIDYLQDNDGEIYFDCDGSIFTGDSYNADKGDCCLYFQCPETSDCGCKEEDFSNSWVKQNKNGGYFEFSDDLVERTVVIEFSSAGLDKLDGCDIKVHNDLEMTVMAFIQYNLLRGKRNVPRGEWKDYYKTFLIEKARSKDLLSDPISLEQIIKCVSLRYNN